MASCLSHRFIFGVQGSRSNAIAFSDQNTIVYVAGHNIVIYSILDGKQRFIHGSESSESITAMALCPSARFVALAENGDKPTVSDEGINHIPSICFVSVVDVCAVCGVLHLTLFSLMVYLLVGQVSVYDLRTLRIRKTLQADGDKSQCVSMAFSHDSNLLLTQGGAPEWTLVLWNWAKARQLAKIRTSETLPVYQVLPSLLSVSSMQGLI